MSVEITVKTEIDDQEYQFVHHPDTCTDDDIDMICRFIKRHLREVYGRSPLYLSSE